jgi:protein-S-isoprenylcysteine O-methyltransferase
MKAGKSLKALVVGILAGLVLLILPLAGNPAMLATAKPWVVLAVAVLASVLQPAYNPFSIIRRPGDRGTGAQIIWTVYGTQLAAVIEAGYWRYPQSVAWTPLAVAAISVAVLGLALRTWAVFTLGRFFTMEIAVTDDHAVISSGPFAIVRHPSYLGAFFLYLGTALFLHAWGAAALAVVALPIAFVRRIRTEEAILAGTLGQTYTTYREQVKARLLPGLW